ncbi:MAG: chemotaxis protein CheW [Oscillatoria sp. PMC 1068.18]|nr:chemotaxis protein CheW [Oscillatoria sp. PMC 1076.18]MEC4989130.1 chemotaxis protein CheW [Oscillatoria sp. PMC 1068.18]
MEASENYFSGNGQELSSDIQELEAPEGQLHLRFFVPSGDEFALPAMGVREVIQQPPDRIAPIPNASPLLLGTINFRGQVIWVADLGQFLGENLALNTERPEIPVIAVEDQETILGLAIEAIGDIDWLDVDQLQMQSNVPDSMAQFVKGEWVLNKEEVSEGSSVPKYLRLLDQVAILRSARWAT